jgi:hypothetical protein
VPKLSVIGLGLRCPEQTSRRSMAALRQADHCFFISDNLEKQRWLAKLNPHFTNLMTYYAKGKPRRQTYEEMAECVLAQLRQGHHAALISYGHPLVFCDPSRLAFEKTLAEGYQLEILPAISSIDCLLAHLRVDTQQYGVQIYEGHDLLLHGIRVDPNSSQIIFQVPSLGDNTGGWTPGRFRGFIRALSEQLALTYGWEHPAILYFGSNAPDRPHRIDSLTLAQLPEAEMVSEYTLWIPPKDYPLLPFEDNSQAQVDLELVGRGCHPDDISQEVEQLADLPVITRLEDWNQPSLAYFDGHPCSSGAVAWARAAIEAGRSFRIRPSISWEGGVYCSVPLDPGLHGFQSYPSGANLPDPLQIGTLQRLPSQLPGPYWGPVSGLCDQPQSDSLARFLAGPDPRPLETAPFERALQLSAVERLVAHLELHCRQLELPTPRKGQTRLWLHTQQQRCQKKLAEDLPQAHLGEDWASHLLKHPEHPLSAWLVLQLRCREASQSCASGVSLTPLEDWFHP